MKRRKPVAVTKGNKTTITIKINLLKLPTGHKAHLSGAGIHAHQTNRQRTRSNKNNQAIQDSLND